MDAATHTHTHTLHTDSDLTTEEGPDLLVSCTLTNQQSSHRGSTPKAANCWPIAGRYVGPMAPAAMLCPYGFGWKEPSLSSHLCSPFALVEFHVDISIGRLLLLVLFFLVVSLVVVVLTVAILVQVFLVALGCSASA